MAPRRPSHAPRGVVGAAAAAPVILVALYVFLWFPPAIRLADPWYEAFAEVKAGMASGDPAARRRLLDRGGVGLEDLCRTYPYHARVHYLLGCYYEYTGRYDSAIVHAKEALRLGSNSIVNRVDGPAAALLDSAEALEAALSQSKQTAGRP